MEHTKCLIIGSGPAGYTAAIYASRANLSPIEYSGLQPGGQLTQTTEVENFPGYPQGVDGNQMMMDLREQAERFGADIRDGSITKVDFSKITYTEPGVYTYTITETGNVPGVVNGTTSYTVVVTVVDNGDGTMTATITEGSAVTAFENTYKTNPTGY